MAGSGNGSGGDKQSSSDTEVDQYPYLFEGIEAYFIEPGVNPRRLQIWKGRVEKMGGKLQDRLSRSTTHIFAMDTKRLLERISPIKIEKLKGMEVLFLRYDWIQESLKAGAMLTTDPYKLSLTAESSCTSAPEQPKMEIPQGSNPSVMSTKDHANDRQRLAEEKVKNWMGLIHEEAKLGDPHVKVSKQQLHEENTYLHQNLDFFHDIHKNEGSDSDLLSSRDSLSDTQEHPGTGMVPHVYAPPDLNKNITAPFEELKDIYKDALGDNRRSFSYYKALSVLEKVPFKITSADQVKDLPTIGKSMRDHIHEILTTGKLSKLENFKNDEMVHSVTLFGSIWGVGPTTARKLYDKGHRTLNDLKNEPSLTKSQKVGLLYHNDLTKKIPREEAKEMEAIVRETTQSIVPETVVVCGGSYRRGKAFIGDMDIVITHPDGTSHKKILRPLVQKLKSMNFLTEDLLVSMDHASQGDEEGVDTYFGLCKYPGRDQRHRIDFKVYSSAQYPFGLIAWTGNDVLNRRLRLLADSKGYRLDDTGLYPVIQDSQGTKILGSRVPCKTERQVFEFLDFLYLEPHERNL